MSDEFGILTDKEQAFVDAYTEKIRKEERERIIAMFEEMREQEFAWRERNGQQHLNPDYGIDVARVIWLIKEEN